MILSRRLGARCGLGLALALGERGFISRRQRSQFVRLGISHLFALSGMHLGILGAALIVFLPRRSGWVIWVLAALLCAFVLVVGDVNSLERALAMALLALLARALGRPVRPLHVWAAAACVLLWSDPASLASVGLQFSLLATLGVMVALDRAGALRAWVRHAGWFRRTIIGILGTIFVGIGATLAVLPLQLHYFEVVSLAGPLATVIFTPVAAAMLVSSLALILVDPLPVVPEIVARVVEALTRTLEWMLEAGAALPVPVLQPAPPDARVYYAGLLFLVSSTGRLGRFAGLLLIAISFVL